MVSLCDPFKVEKREGVELEVEARFGTYSGKFEPGVHTDVFYTAITTLNCSSYEYSRTTIYNGGYRQVDTADSYANLMADRYSKTEYQHKETVSTVDHNGLGIRLSAAYERTVKPDRNFSGRPEMVRKRIRCVKNIVQDKKLGDAYVFHITHVMTENRSKYEIEVEFQLSAGSLKKAADSEDEVFKHLSRIRRIIYNTVVASSGDGVVETLNRELDYEGDKNSYVTENLKGYLDNEGDVYEYAPPSSEVKFKFNKPIDMDSGRYMRVIRSGEYTVSLKADGVHGFLLQNKTGSYVITGMTMVNTLSQRVTNPETTILEGEMVSIRHETIQKEEKKVIIQKFFIAFDILKHDGNYTIGMRYPDRLALLEQVCAEMSDKLPVAMKRVYQEELSKSLAKMMVTGRKDPVNYYSVPPKFTIQNFLIKAAVGIPLFETDGIIFTSKKPYLSPVNFRSNDSLIYKWKPKRQLTIDFQVGNNYVLQVIHNNSLVMFNGNYEVSIKAAYLDKGDREKVSIGQIAEFRLKEIVDGVAYFNYVRSRQDKKFPNSSYVARDVWSVIHKHVSVDTLTGNDLELVRKHHNQVKKEHILRHVKHDDIVLDIGGGRGGDLEKYIEAEAKAVVFVEPDADNLRELQNRIGGLKKKYNTNQNTFMNTTFYWMKGMGQDTARIKSYMKELGLVADVVAMFFSLTFFYQNESDLTSLAATIRECSKPDSVFIGTVMDGSSTKRYIESGQSVPYFRVSLTGKKGYTEQVRIQLPKETIVGDQIENLVHFNYLAKKLGTDCYQYQVFKDWNELSDVNQVINRLYYTFTLKNTSHALEVGEYKTVSGSFNLLGTEGSLTAALLTAISVRYRECKDRAGFVQDLHQDLAEHLTEDRYYKYFPRGDRDRDLQKIQTLGLDETHLAFLSDLYQLNIIVLDCLYQIKSINGKTEDWSFNQPLAVVLYQRGDHYDIIARVQKETPCDGATKTIVRNVFPTHDFRINRLLIDKSI